MRWRGGHGRVDGGRGRKGGGEGGEREVGGRICKGEMRKAGDYAEGLKK